MNLVATNRTQAGIICNPQGNRNVAVLLLMKEDPYDTKYLSAMGNGVSKPLERVQVLPKGPTRSMEDTMWLPRGLSHVVAHIVCLHYQNTPSDHPLLDRDETASELGRANLRNIDRSLRREHADSEPIDNASNYKHCKILNGTHQD